MFYLLLDIGALFTRPLAGPAINRSTGLTDLIETLLVCCPITCSF